MVTCQSVIVEILSIGITGKKRFWGDNGSILAVNPYLGKNGGIVLIGTQIVKIIAN